MMVSYMQSKPRQRTTAQQKVTDNHHPYNFVAFVNSPFQCDHCIGTHSSIVESVGVCSVSVECTLLDYDIVASPWPPIEPYCMYCAPAMGKSTHFYSPNPVLKYVPIILFCEHTFPAHQGNPHCHVVSCSHHPQWGAQFYKCCSTI